MPAYPGVGIQQTAGDDGVQEDLVRSDDVVKVLGPLHLRPKLIPGALEHLEGDVVLRLVDEVHHLRRQHMALVQHARELCKAGRSVETRTQRHWAVGRPWQAEQMLVSTLSTETRLSFRG